jgi:DNA-binding transcriptional MerR regulator
MDEKNNNLIKITELSAQLGLSSRSLRYYEQAGLIKSIRPEFEKYRFYDAENIERLRQIIVLRKMQIPVKDILRIYESESMSVVVETFVNRIRAIDDEIGALSELKRIVEEFLHTMQSNGITKISAIPILYEEMGKQFELMEERKPDSNGELPQKRTPAANSELPQERNSDSNGELSQERTPAANGELPQERTPATYAELSAVSDKLTKPLDFSIVDLPPMRVLTSFRKPDTTESDFLGFSRYIQINALPQASSGNHMQFEFQTEAGDVLMVRIPEDFVNDSGYLDYTFAGGLFAAVNVYLDEDLGQCFRALVSELDANAYYQFAYCADGTSRHPVLIENLISPDDKRELVSMLVPVKKRIANPALFDAPAELPANSVTIPEIEAANPVLWEVNVALNKLTPINSPHYRITDDGEAEYTGWISTRVLNTNVAVKLPFRVDIEFRLAGDDEKFGYGDSEGSIIFYHGEDTGYFAGGSLGQMGFGINMGNHVTASPQREEALSFRQPVFRDLYHFPGRGKIEQKGYNRVTWIVGEKHFAVIVNGEIRYCAADFPYMSLDLSRERPYNIVIGSNGQGMKYFREIRVSQLVYAPKSKIKKEELDMVTKKSNNIIPNVHRLITDEYGENYWFNGCAKYVMESLGEGDYDYQFFAGLTGDVFAQHYANGEFRGEGVSGYSLGEGSTMYLREGVTALNISGGAVAFIEETFAKCGYAASFVLDKELRKNTEMYLQTLMAYIDKGIPVISWGHGGPPIGVYVGYEEYGQTLLYITGNNNEPERMPLEKALKIDEGLAFGGWIFVGDKKENRPLAEIYRETIKGLPGLLTKKTDKFCFGAEAFRVWASDIKGGKFDGADPEKFDLWSMYTSYICGMATNGSCCHEFLKRARELNPDMTFLEEVSRLYKRTADIWNNDNGTDLEAIGGGFNVTLETLQNPQRRAKIAAKIREAAAVTDEIVRIITEGLSKTEGANPLTCESFE